MPAPTTKMRQSDLFAELPGVAGTWATSSAPSMSGTSTKVRDGGGPAESLPGEVEWSDMTFGRPFDRARDFATFRQLKAMYGRDVTVVIKGKTSDGIVIEKFTVLGRIGGVTGPSGDSMSTTGPTLEFSLSVDDVL